MMRIEFDSVEQCVEELGEITADVIAEKSAEKPTSKRKAPRLEVLEHEPIRFVELKRETHIFMHRLGEQEKRDHARLVYEMDCQIAKAKEDASEAKTFVTNDLIGSEPVRRRAREKESKRRAALYAVEKKRAELLRELHLDAAADGYMWIDVQCVTIADDIDCTITTRRTDTDETVTSREMDETDLERRKRRLQMNFPGVE